MRVTLIRYTLLCVCVCIKVRMTMTTNDEDNEDDYCSQVLKDGTEH